MALAGEGPGGSYRWKGWEEGEPALEMVEKAIGKHYFFFFYLIYF